LLAEHPRFKEANSQEKREFIAEKLFGPELEAHDYHFGVVAIARRASLIYWWEVEPAEQATIADRVRALRDRGTSIRNIAATVKISEAKVRAYVQG